MQLIHIVAGHAIIIFLRRHADSATLPTKYFANRSCFTAQSETPKLPGKALDNDAEKVLLSKHNKEHRLK